MFKIDFDHVDFVVAARSEKLRYLTADSTVYCSPGLPTSTDSATGALLSFFPFVRMIQKCTIKLRRKNSGAQKTSNILTRAIFRTVHPQHKQATVTPYILGHTTTL